MKKKRKEGAKRTYDMSNDRTMMVRRIAGAVSGIKLTKDVYGKKWTNQIFVTCPFWACVLMKKRIWPIYILRNIFLKI